MIYENVAERLKQIASLGDDEIEAYEPFILLAISWVEKKAQGAADADVSMLEMLAAAKANYDASLAFGKEEVTSFKAGDLSITKRGSVSSAKELLESALSACSDFITAEGFAFRTV